MSCLYILEINSLSVASLANIFSHSEGCLFVLFMASFAVEKLLGLIAVLSCVQLFVTLLTLACQDPLSMEFSRQEYWSGLLFPTPGDLSDPRRMMQPPASLGRFFTNNASWEALYLGSICFCFYFHYSRKWVKKNLAVIFVSVLPVFLSKSFIVTGLTFRALIHF